MRVGRATLGPNDVVGVKYAGHVDLGNSRPDEGRTVDGVVVEKLDANSVKDGVERLKSTSNDSENGRDETRISDWSSRYAGGKDCRSNDRCEAHRGV